MHAVASPRDQGIHAERDRPAQRGLQCGNARLGNNSRRSGRGGLRGRGGIACGARPADGRAGREACRSGIGRLGPDRIHPAGQRAACSRSIPRPRCGRPWRRRARRCILGAGRPAAALAALARRHRRRRIRRQPPRLPHPGRRAARPRRVRRPLRPAASLFDSAAIAAAGRCGRGTRAPRRLPAGPRSRSCRRGEEGPDPARSSTTRPYRLLYTRVVHGLLAADKKAASGAKRKAGFGNYKVSFAGRKETAEEIFGKTPIPPQQMTKKIWDYVKSNGLSSK